MGGDPWEPKGIPWEGIPWEGTHGRGNPWEPKGSHGRGSRTPHGRGTLGSPREPMGGDPWGPQWDVFFVEVAFLEDPPETKIQNHSHEIRLEKLVCILFTRCNFAFTRYQNIEKPLNKEQVWLHLAWSSPRIHQKSYEIL